MSGGTDVATLPGERHGVERLSNIHLRNIVGNCDDFIEAWPDDGSIDPDHAPDRPDDEGGKQSYAHAHGFILGAIKAAEHRQRGRQ